MVWYGRCPMAKRPGAGAARSELSFPTLRAAPATETSITHQERQEHRDANENGYGLRANGNAPSPGGVDGRDGKRVDRATPQTRRARRTFDERRRRPLYFGRSALERRSHTDSLRRTL